MATSVSLRHTLATLAYRAAKPLRDVPPKFSEFRACKGSRSAGEILAHLSDLLDWALTQAKGKEEWHDSTPRSWEEDSVRFFTAVTAFDNHLASNAELPVSAESIFQGAIADALTHVGQLSLLRRLVAAPVRPENYSVAKIEVGNTDSVQSAAVSEWEAV